MRTLWPPGDGDLSDEDLEALYLTPEGRHVRANFVLSVDGAAEFDGRSRPLATADDTTVFGILRAVSDVVLVGARTARREDYGPAKVAESRRRRRLARGQTPQPPVAVVTARGDLDPESRLFSGSGAPGYVAPLVFVGEGIAADRRRTLDKVAEVVECRGKVVSMTDVVEALWGRGLQRVLCEGGPMVVSELLGRGLLDELCLTHTSVVAGPGRATLTTGVPFAAPVHLDMQLLIRGEGALLGRYAVVREEGGI
jgi:riboflavin biosynthesis pyrimidine reductase